MKLSVFPDAPENFCSVHFWQRDVEDDHIGLTLPETLYRLHPTGEFQNVVLVLQNRPDDQTIVGVIVHDSHFVHARANNITSKTAGGSYAEIWSCTIK